MKKTLFFLFIATTLWSCKRDDLAPANSNTTVNGGKLKPLSAGDGKWDVLGYGLDVTGNLLDISSVSDAPIFDMTRFEKDYLSRINVITTTEGSENYYSGITAVDYLKDVTTKKSFDLDENNQPKVGSTKIEGANPDGSNPFFSGSLSKNSSDENKTTYSSRYSYATYEVVQRVKRVAFTGDVSTNLLMQYLTPEFVNNVTTLTADQLVARYGTHVMLDISIGGRLKFDYNASIVSETDYAKKTSDVKAGLGFSLLKVIGVNINKDKSTEEVNEITGATTNKQYTAKYYGGTNSGRSVSIDKDGNSSETINISSWQQSVNATNAALLDVGKALYLYDFIADPAKKALVKAAVEKHILDSQVKLTFTKTKLYRSCNQQTLDRLLSIDPNEVANQPVWKFEYSLGLVYTDNSMPGLVPIRKFVLHNLSHFYTTNLNENPSGAKNEGVVGYVNSSVVAGYKPIYRYRNDKLGTHIYSSDFNELHGGFDDWKYEGIIGYLE